MCWAASHEMLPQVLPTDGTEDDMIVLDYYCNKVDLNREMDKCACVLEGWATPPLVSWGLASEDTISSINLSCNKYHK